MTDDLMKLDREKKMVLVVKQCKTSQKKDMIATPRRHAINYTPDTRNNELKKKSNQHPRPTNNLGP